MNQKIGKDEENTKYVSGTYEVTVPCEPDEDEDFERYNLTMSVTIRDDKIIAITDITGDGASDNDRYILKAANGTSSIKGVVSQIIEKGNVGGHRYCFPRNLLFKCDPGRMQKSTGSGRKTDRYGG